MLHCIIWRAADAFVRLASLTMSPVQPMAVRPCKGRKSKVQET